MRGCGCSGVVKSDDVIITEISADVACLDPEPPNFTISEEGYPGMVAISRNCPTFTSLSSLFFVARGYL